MSTEQNFQWHLWLFTMTTIVLLGIVVPVTVLVVVLTQLLRFPACGW